MFNNRGLSVTILATRVQKEAVARKAHQLGGLGACPLRKSLDFRPSEVVSGAIWK